jgi:hypothetical protein
MAPESGRCASVKAVAWALASIVLPLLITEFTELGPWLAERLVRRSVRMLPAEHRDRYTDEWLAELDVVPGKILKLIIAVRLALRVPATSLAVQDITFPLALQRAVAGQFTKNGLKLANRAYRLRDQSVSDSSHRYTGVWRRQHLRELHANLLRSAAVGCFTVGFTVQFMPLLRRLNRSGMKWYQRYVPKVRILGQDKVHIDFGGPKTATREYKVSFKVAVDEDED